MSPISQEIHGTLWSWKLTELFSEDLKYLAKAEMSAFPSLMLMALETLKKKKKIPHPLFHLKQVLPDFLLTGR